MKIEKASEAEPGYAITFRLDPRSGVPTYLQLVHQVEHALRLGRVTKGDQLPRIKDVVASLSINPNTVLKAYRQLEQKGLISSRPGQGTFVDAEPATADFADLAALRQKLDGWFRDAATAGLDGDGIVALFTSALRDFHELRPGAGTTRRRGGARRAGGVA